MRNIRQKFGWSRALVAALPLFVGACTVVPDWADPFVSNEAPAAVTQGQSAGSDSFPKLSSVPDAAPKTTSPAAQAELRATLAADRASADEGSDKSTAKMPLSTVPKAPISVKTTDASPAPTKVAAPKTPEQTPSEPVKSAFRFTQFDKEATATPPAALNTELVAVIYFGYGSTALNRDDREVLRDVVELQKQRGATIRVIGHASARTGVIDSVRYRLANFETSLQRANAVTAQLVRLGVARDKVVAEAKGDSQPVFHEFMPTGEAGNRRAEIFLEN